MLCILLRCLLSQFLPSQSFSLCRVLSLCMLVPSVRGCVLTTSVWGCILSRGVFSHWNLFSLALCTVISLLFFIFVTCILLLFRLLLFCKVLVGNPSFCQLASSITSWAVIGVNANVKRSIERELDIKSSSMVAVFGEISMILNVPFWGH